MRLDGRVEQRQVGKGEQRERDRDRKGHIEVVVVCFSRALNFGIIERETR